MKIRKLTDDNFPRAAALLEQAFRGTNDPRIFEELHNNHRPIHDWVCIHRNRVVAYICFSNAYNKTDICGLHLSLLAVKSDFRHQGIGSEILRFALRQEFIKDTPLFTVGQPGFFRKFGFDFCHTPVSKLRRSHCSFLSLNNTITESFAVGYEPEFKVS